jgi:hypothetical protein
MGAELEREARGADVHRIRAREPAREPLRRLVGGRTVRPLAVTMLPPASMTRAASASQRLASSSPSGVIFALGRQPLQALVDRPYWPGTPYPVGSGSPRLSFCL